MWRSDSIPPDMSFENPNGLEKVAFRVWWSCSGALIHRYLRRAEFRGDEAAR